MWCTFQADPVDSEISASWLLGKFVIRLLNVSATWLSVTVKVIMTLITSRLPWQPDGIKFTQCISDQKSAFSSLQEKLCVGSECD